MLVEILSILIIISLIKLMMKIFFNEQKKDLSYKYKDLEKDLKSLNGRNETLERELKVNIKLS